MTSLLRTFGILEGIYPTLGFNCCSSVCPNAKGMTGDWTDLKQTAFLKVKHLVPQVRALTVSSNGEPFELDVAAEPTGYGWGSLAKTGWLVSAYCF